MATVRIEVEQAQETASRAVVSCRGLTKRFAGVAAVADLDLDVRAGELLALLGPSGCGKTTTLRLIAGFEWPDEGAIFISGKRVAGEGSRVAPEHRKVGMVFQDYPLFPHMTVAQNVAFGLHRVPRREAMRRSEKARCARRIAKRVAQLANQRCEIALGHERGWPELLVQLLFRQRPRTLFDENLEQLIRLRRDVDFRVAASQLASLCIEDQIAKTKLHRAETR